MEKFFKLQENHTNVRTEVIAGITTFMTMAYILAVNPNILSASGMDPTAILIATCLASFIGTLCMAFMANYPFVLAPGMGLNAYFAFTVCGTYGYSWKVALGAVLVEGLVFIILSLTNVREAIFNAIPTTLKHGVSTGIGLFVAFIGMQGAHIVVNSDSTLLTYVSFKNTIHQEGICAILAIIGVLIIAVLYTKGVMGSILIGILSTWILGMICQAIGIYIPDVENGFYSLYPSLGITDFTKIGETFGAAITGFTDGSFSNVGIFNFVTIVFSFLFVDIFDTLGTLIGCSEKAGFLDKEGKLPNIKGALLADAVATTAGAVLGTSTTTTYVESSAGVGAGGRTGLTAVVTGFLFLIAILFAPVFTAIPGFATAPALMFVGFLMLSSFQKIDFADYRESVPAYLAIITMPLCYSISEGIAFGIIAYVVINTVCNFIMKDKRKVTPLMYILAVLFVCKYIFL